MIDQTHNVMRLAFIESASCLMPWPFLFAGFSKFNAGAAFCFLVQNYEIGCFCGPFQPVEQYWLFCCFWPALFQNLEVLNGFRPSPASDCGPTLVASKA